MRSTPQAWHWQEGWIEYRMVRCGRRTCRCAKGVLHGPYAYLTYRDWDEDGERLKTYRRYVRPEQLPAVQARLAARRQMVDVVRWLEKSTTALLAGLRVRRLAALEEKKKHYPG